MRARLRLRPPRAHAAPDAVRGVRVRLALGGDDRFKRTQRGMLLL